MDALQLLGDNDVRKMLLLRGSSRAQLLGRLLKANLNITTDQKIPLISSQLFGYRVLVATMTNASGTPSTAVGGIYTAASKGGTAIVAASQAYSALTAANLCLDLTVAAVPGTTVFPAGTSLYFSLTTPQGAPMTADLYLYGVLF